MTTAVPAVNTADAIWTFSTGFNEEDESDPFTSCRVQPLEQHEDVSQALIQISSSTSEPQKVAKEEEEPQKASTIPKIHETQIGQNAMWTFGTGGFEEEDELEHFTMFQPEVVDELASMSDDGEASEFDEQPQSYSSSSQPIQVEEMEWDNEKTEDANEEEARSQMKRLSLERKEEDLVSVCPPSPAPATICEDSEYDDSLSLASPISTMRNRVSPASVRSKYRSLPSRRYNTSQFEKVRMTPSTLLSKVMPIGFKKANDIVSLKKSRSENRKRECVKNRSERLAHLKSSFLYLDAFDDSSSTSLFDSSTSLCDSSTSICDSSTSLRYLEKEDSFSTMGTSSTSLSMASMGSFIANTLDEDEDDRKFALSPILSVDSESTIFNADVSYSLQSTREVLNDSESKSKKKKNSKSSGPKSPKSRKMVKDKLGSVDLDDASTGTDKKNKRSSSEKKTKGLIKSSIKSAQKGMETLVVNPTMAVGKAAKSGVEMVVVNPTMAVDKSAKSGRSLSHVPSQRHSDPIERHSDSIQSHSDPIRSHSERPARQSSSTKKKKSKSGRSLSSVPSQRHSDPIQRHSDHIQRHSERSARQPSSFSSIQSSTSFA